MTGFRSSSLKKCFKSENKFLCLLSVALGYCHCLSHFVRNLCQCQPLNTNIFCKPGKVHYNNTIHQREGIITEGEG